MPLRFDSILNDALPLAAAWWLPPNLSEHGRSVDSLFSLIAWVTLTVFVGVHVCLIAFLVRYRHRKGATRRATFTHGNTRLEIGWTILPAVILGVLAMLSVRVWDDYHRPAAAGVAVTRVLVIGQQFKWNVIYPGPDGQLGRYLVYPRPTDSRWPGGERFRGTNGPAELPSEKAVETINAYVDGVNPLGKDFADPAGTDDDWQNALARDLVVPVGRPVEVRLTSRDVIHSFAVPNLRVKMDAVPGIIGTLRFTPIVTTEQSPGGAIDILCTELCGAGHYTMLGRLVVTPVDAPAAPATTTGGSR